MDHLKALVTFRRLIGIVGLGMIALALTAGVVGLDADDAWGPSRKFLLLLGIGITTMAALPEISWAWSRVSESVLQALTGNVSALLRSGFILSIATATQKAMLVPLCAIAERIGLVIGFARITWALKQTADRLKQTRVAKILFGSHSRAELTSACFIIIACVVGYIWLVSVGTWLSWPTHTSYFNLQSQAFLQGQLHLPVEPDPKLGELGNPYDPASREANKVEVMWDASYYEGRYFLYWGPTPALILAPVKSVTGANLGDQVLVLAFAIGILITTSALLIHLRRDLFREVSWWITLPAILAAGLANPLPWVLNRPAMYEAAITSGQFFFLAGLFLTVRGCMQEHPSARHRFLAGTLFALAIASRRNLLLPTGFVVLGSLAFELRQARLPHDSPRILPRSMFAQILPIVAGGSGLLWYNWARFGNILDFGQRYQLSRANVYAAFDGVVSLANVLPNLQNYLVNPPRLLSVFPYLKPDWGSHSIWMFHTYAGEYYYSEQITGLLFSIPLILFALSPLALLARRSMRAMSLYLNEATGPLERADRIAWITAILAGSVLFSFAPLLLFWSATMRHLTDVVPSVLALSQIGVLLRIEAARQNSRRSWPIVLSAVGLAILTAATGLLLGITGYEARFERLNPELFDALTRFFTP